MTTETDALRDQLLALMNFPELDVPEYWASSAVVGRVGTMLAGAAARVPVRPAGMRLAVALAAQKRNPANEIDRAP